MQYTKNVLASNQSQDTHGDLYEYMLNHLNIARRNGPFHMSRQREEFASEVSRFEALRGRMSEAERQVEGLFQSLLAQSFSVGLSQSFGG
jgi:hypothetical protein